MAGDFTSEDAMKVKKIERELNRAGYQLVRQRGSHRQYRSPDGLTHVTVSGKLGDEMTPGQLADIRRRTGLRLR